MRPLVTVDPDGTGRIEVHVELDRARNLTYTLVAAADGHEARTQINADTA